jgi:hypothetical protein
MIPNYPNGITVLIDKCHVSNVEFREGENGTFSQRQENFILAENE